MTPHLTLRVALALGALLATSRADEPAVSIADLAAYQAAMAAGPAPSAVAPVTFRELWDHPQAHQGCPVQVEGRLARLFRQPAIGQFPPLAEAWITSPLGEPTCLVFPTSGPEPTGPHPGDQVRFVGTFLRRITYAGADARRVAPLIVGPPAPSVLAPGSAAGSVSFGPIFGGDHAADWGLGLAASVGVLWVLLRRHLARPFAALPAPVGPAPTFLDGVHPAETFEGADDDAL